MSDTNSTRKCHDCGKLTDGKSRCPKCRHQQAVGYRKRRARELMLNGPRPSRRPPPKLPPGMRSWCRRCDRPTTTKGFCPACKVIKFKDKCRSCGKPISGYGMCEKCRAHEKVLRRMRKDEGYTKQKCPHCGKRAHPYRSCYNGLRHRLEMEKLERRVMGEEK